MPRARFNLYVPLLAPALALLVIGVLFVYSASSGSTHNYLPRQLTWALIGLGLALVTSMVPLRLWRHWVLPLYLGSLGMLVVVLLFGDVRNGARCWLGVGGLGIQPSEFAKVGLILIVARYLSDFEEHRHDLRYFMISFGLLALPLLLILAQPDLGTALVFLPTVLAMFYVTGTRLLLLGSTLGAGLLCFPVLWLTMSARQKDRILFTWHPELDALGIGYQAVQSKIAIGSGRLRGLGFLHSVQSRLNFLPERHTDFVFSVIGEEWGFAGGLLVIGLYVWLITVALAISYRATDVFSRAVAVGIATLFATHVVLNIGMTVGLLPIIGLPLPFVSYGGSAMITSLIALALLHSVQCQATA
jgi:rod shape determining protein RodA